MVDNRKFSVGKILKAVFLSIILPANVFSAEGKVIYRLPDDDYYRSPLLRIDAGKIYIVDQALKMGFIYDRSDLKKKAEFGGPGEGPGEFPHISNFTINTQFIYVSGMGRLSIFSRDGKYIKDIKSPSIGYGYSPIGNNFIGTANITRNPDPNYINLQFNLYDSQLKKKKELLKTTIHVNCGIEGGQEFIYLIDDHAAAVVYNDTVFIGTTEKGFSFSIFNIDGRNHYDIKVDVEKRKITGEERQKKIDSLRSFLGEKLFKAEYERKKIKFKFPDYYPAYRAFFVNDGRIYVFCYPQDKQNEVYILDLKGNILGKRFIPTSDIGGVNSRYHCMYNGNLYEMRLGPNDENELHEIKIYR